MAVLEFTYNDIDIDINGNEDSWRASGRYGGEPINVSAESDNPIDTLALMLISIAQSQGGFHRDGTDEIIEIVHRGRTLRMRFADALNSPTQQVSRVECSPTFGYGTPQESVPNHIGMQLPKMEFRSAIHFLMQLAAAGAKLEETDDSNSSKVGEALNLVYAAVQDHRRFAA